MAETIAKRPTEKAEKSPAAKTGTAKAPTSAKAVAKPAAKTAAKPATRKAPAAKTAASKPVATTSKPVAKAKSAARKTVTTKSSSRASASKSSSKPARKVTKTDAIKTDKESIIMTKTLEAKAIEAPEFVRAFAEKTVEQARESYARVKGTAEEATDAIEETFETARDNLLDVQHKSLDIAKANMDATFDFARSLLGVTSLGDAVQLQTSFARDRFEAAMDYSKVLQSSATKMAEETSKPAKAVFTKAVDSVKAA